ncbi:MULTISPECIES: endonuclease/exonuclease/phosphatase family protein [unclassified Streptomyces]|uniref:endonuclease/exonuclease/phosphatase family protein n=1 Tax=unclassified Streptomyces TaxID=2593676 RepID=UPI0022572E60|nr:MULTISPECIES: endonuclease/exonuclease/phosphatase family protein [unclassified Streptomyces]MCX5335667.1 endonuclease/exonuclease/phosphatase family protein [Streptomyces sp. NBC_00140]MCX5366383.1 endonuclease/exonuclease/phosphatase family protein [Streptomyces sp. NBC_00124]
MCVRIGEASVFGRGTRLFAGAVIVACVALVGHGAVGSALFGKSVSAGAVKQVVANRVMTWNLCNPCEESNVDRAAEIAEYAPQVIAVQEACAPDVKKIRDYLESLFGLVYHVEYGSVLQNWGRCGGAPWNPGGYGQALLSAAPMTDRVNVEYPDGGSEDRGFMAVTTRVGGKAVRVFNTHLAQRRQEEVRAEQVGVLAKAIARHDRAIVLGDFNAVPDAPELSPIWALAMDTDPQCRPSSMGVCEPTTDWQSKFDYVFLRGITSLTHRVHPSRYSDHKLLQADLDPA